MIVSITDGVEEITHITSGVQWRYRSSNGQSSVAHGSPQDAVSRRRVKRVKEERRDDQNKFYGKVIHAVRDAQSIFIFGSPRAKMTLKEELLKTELPSYRIAGTETAERMTERRLVVMTREICKTLAAQ
jgi:hypothetical protein